MFLFYLDERANLGRLAPEAAQSSSTAPQRSVAETSQSPPREPRTRNDSLIFQMDDIDFSPEDSTSTSTGVESSGFQGSSQFSSNTSMSGNPFELREQPSRIRRCCHHSPDVASLKWTESPRCKMPIWTPLQNPNDATDLKSREFLSEVPIGTNEVAGCSHHNSGTNNFKIAESQETGQPLFCTRAATDTNRTELLERDVPTITQGVCDCLQSNPNTISKVEESQVIDKSSEHKLDETGLKRTELSENEMIKDIPGCSYQHKDVPKQEESKITDNASYAAPSSADENANYSLPSNLHLDDAPPSNFLVSQRSPTHSLSTSSPSVYDLSRSTSELKSSKETSSIALDTSEELSTSNLSKFETLRISNFHPIDKSKTSSESSSSFEMIPEIMPNGDNAIHGESDVFSNSIVSSQLNNTAIQAESSHGSSQTISTSNSLKLSPGKSKSPRRRTSSKSD